ncbi:hypothetical protein DV702_15190 [Sporosarcina sp. PTS2304]|nr:hypothetical protein DV702_15190 [Sporosarcina sp. PTS2304]
MLFIQFLTIAIWIIPILFFASIYMKMDKKDRGKFRTELKRPSVYLGMGIPVIGTLILFTGIFSATKWLQHIGVIMLLGS